LNGNKLEICRFFAARHRIFHLLPYIIGNNTERNISLDLTNFLKSKKYIGILYVRQCWMLECRGLAFLKCQSCH